MFIDFPVGHPRNPALVRCLAAVKQRIDSIWFYPLVNVYVAMENHNFQWVNPLLITGWWFQTWILFSISYMGCHPSHWRTPSFFEMVIAPPTRFYCVVVVCFFLWWWWQWFRLIPRTGMTIDIVNKNIMFPIERTFQYISVEIRNTQLFSMVIRGGAP